jgi:hypothetical protein
MDKPLLPKTLLGGRRFKPKFSPENSAEERRELFKIGAESFSQAPPGETKNFKTQKELEADSLKQTKDILRQLVKNFLLSKFEGDDHKDYLLSTFDPKSYFSDDAPRRLKGFQVQNVKRGLKEVMHEFTKKQRELFYERLNVMGQLQEFIKLSRVENTVIPIEIAREAKSWLKNNAAPDKAEQALTIIDVETLLPDGEADTMEGLSAKSPRDLSDEDKAVRTQPRIDWILSALKEDGFALGNLKLYRQKHLETHNPDKSNYSVLEVQNDDHHFQIAISEIIGNATFIIRSPIDFQGDNVVTVSDLKHMNTVFQTNCYTEAQWIRDIRKYAYTPLNELPVQIKTRTAWGDKKDTVTESFRLFYRDTRQIPFTYDESIIQHGALAGRTTFARIYYALQRGSIIGLEHVRNFRELRDHIFGSNVPAPIIPFDAQEVFRQAVLDIQKTGNLPNLGPAFERALQAKEVTALEEVIDGDADSITTAKAFLLATGVATETSDGDIEPAPPAVIRQFVRLLKI